VTEGKANAVTLMNPNNWNFLSKETAVFKRQTSKYETHGVFAKGRAVHIYGKFAFMARSKETEMRPK
jgi:hypothetical protein